ncbi:Ribokinase [Streptomyces hirsutus]
MVGFILVEPSGENRISIAPGALDELDAAAVESFHAEIAAADILVVSMEIPEAAVAAALRAGRRAGTTTLLNPAPARPLPDDLWPLIDVITPNQTEAPVLLGLQEGHGLDDGELKRRLCALTGGAAVLTRGGEGSTRRTGGRAAHGFRRTRPSPSSTPPERATPSPPRSPCPSPRDAPSPRRRTSPGWPAPTP